MKADHPETALTGPELVTARVEEMCTPLEKGFLGLVGGTEKVALPWTESLSFATTTDIIPRQLKPGGRRLGTIIIRTSQI